MKLFLIIFIILVILGFLAFKFVYPCVKARLEALQSTITPKGEIMYSSPIGPTQTSPYRLNSSILRGVPLR